MKKIIFLIIAVAAINVSAQFKSADSLAWPASRDSSYVIDLQTQNLSAIGYQAGLSDTVVYFATGFDSTDLKDVYLNDGTRFSVMLRTTAGVTVLDPQKSYSFLRYLILIRTAADSVQNFILIKRDF